MREQDLQAYSKHPKIKPKFSKEYKTELTFGIHCGTSIEGSIGTEMKVDSLFISPDTQIASRIEDLNEAYKTSIDLAFGAVDRPTARLRFDASTFDMSLVNNEVITLTNGVGGLQGNLFAVAMFAQAMQECVGNFDVPHVIAKLDADQLIAEWNNPKQGCSPSFYVDDVCKTSIPHKPL